MTFVALINVFGVGGIFYALWLFGRLARYRYENHRAEWQHDGKPIGKFWRPVEVTLLSNRSPDVRWQVALLFRMPPWVAASRECRGWLFQIRLITLLLAIPLSHACYHLAFLL